jgi:hypothetical protein
VKTEGEVTAFGVTIASVGSDGGAVVLLGQRRAVVTAETDHDGSVTTL